MLIFDWHKRSVHNEGAGNIRKAAGPLWFCCNMNESNFKLAKINKEVLI